jgi:hypothetical protein
MIPFRKLIEKTMTKINIRMNFRLSLKKQETSMVQGDKVSKSDAKHKRLESMEKYYTEQQRLKEEKEKEEERLRLLEKEKEDEFSQFESDTSPKRDNVTPYTQKQMNNIKDKFGHKFLDMFTKTLIQTITESGGDPEEISKYNYYKSPIGNKTRKMGGSNGKIPNFYGYNDEYYYDTYKGSSHNNSDGRFQPIHTSYQHLQSNINHFRSDTTNLTRRQLVNKHGTPQKYGLNGRRTGNQKRNYGIRERTLGNRERHTGNRMRGVYTKDEQGLSCGVMGMAMTRQNRVSTTNNELPNRNVLLKSTEKAQQEQPKLTRTEVLSVVEKLCVEYGTPLTVEGHREALIDQISNNEELRNNKELRYTLLSNHYYPKKTHVTLPNSSEKERLNVELISPSHNHNAKTYERIIEPRKQSVFLPSSDGVPNKKYLLSYMNAKDSEKDKIINLFSRIFKEFHFNKKEDKDLILRHIR